MSQTRPHAVYTRGALMTSSLRARARASCTTAAASCTLMSWSSSMSASRVCSEPESQTLYFKVTLLCNSKSRAASAMRPSPALLLRHATEADARRHLRNRSRGHGYGWTALDSPPVATEQMLAASRPVRDLRRSEEYTSELQSPC